MRNKLRIVVLVFLAHNLSYSNSDTLTWNISVGNRFIFPVRHAYTETYGGNPFGIDHYYIGETKVQVSDSYLNPFIEFNYRKALKKYQRLSFEYTLGFQYIQLQNKKRGWFYNTGEGTIYNGSITLKSEDYSVYFTFRAIYKLFTYKGITFYPKLDMNMEQVLPYGKGNVSINATRNGGTLPNVVYSYPYGQGKNYTHYTSNIWLHCEYSLSNNIRLCAEAGLYLVHVNEFSKTYYDPMYGSNYNTPYYIMDYRSNINNSHYYRINLSLLFFIHKKHKKS